MRSSRNRAYSYCPNKEGDVEPWMKVERERGAQEGAEVFPLGVGRTEVAES